MNKLFLIALLSFVTLSQADAEYVDGYYRKDGTYVAPHYRSNPNGTATDNYSYQGNINPYTGQQGQNRYPHDTTSPYFNGTPYGNGQYGHPYGQYGR